MVNFSFPYSKYVPTMGFWLQRKVGKGNYFWAEPFDGTHSLRFKHEADLIVFKLTFGL